MKYDLVVIGGGSAGYNAARVAAGLGRRVAVVDGARELGGLCILRGCMPSKTLLYATEVLQHARHGRDFGLKIPLAQADVGALHRRKLRLIADFAGHRQKQLRHGKFRLYRHHARFVDPHTVELDDGRRLRGRHFLIATGSVVSSPPIPGLDRIEAWTSDDVVDLDRAPRSVVVLGGGLVACELAQFLGRIGSRVIMVQRGTQLLTGHGPQAAGVLKKALEAEGIEIFTGTRLARIARDRRGVAVHFRQGRRARVRRAEHCFNALGRHPQVAGLGLEAAGVKTAENGRVLINRWQQTNVPHIYAAGDCSGPVEIVHIAVAQGELAARHAAGVKGLKTVNYDLMLNVVFTEPAVAAIGLSEAELKRRKKPYLAASYPFDDHGKSILMNALYGYVKVMAEPKRGRILGAEIVGPDAGELIHCFSGPLAMGATVFDLLKAPWYHPTLSEILTYPLEEIAEKIQGKADPIGPGHD